MAEGRVFQLEIIDPEGNHRKVTIGERLTIGRQQGNDVVLPDQRVSRRHALIECQGEVCHIVDLASSNGTYIGGERLPPNVPTPLNPEVEVIVGGCRLKLVTVPIPAAAEGPKPSAVEAPAEVPAAVEEAEERQEEQKVPLSEALSGAPPPRRPKRRGPPPPPGAPGPPTSAPGEPPLPVGLEVRSWRLLQYLPGIYQTDFASRFLGIFEAILTPIEWTIDNFDLYLRPDTTPLAFLDWLASWFGLTFDSTWTEEKRRQLIKEAHQIFARRGTRWALSRVLEIYTGYAPKIIDTDPSLEPFTFRVILPGEAAHYDQALLERLIEAHKPAHTMYSLEFTP